MKYKVFSSYNEIQDLKKNSNKLCFITFLKIPISFIYFPNYIHDIIKHHLARYLKCFRVFEINFELIFVK